MRIKISFDLDAPDCFGEGFDWLAWFRVATGILLGSVNESVAEDFSISNFIVERQPVRRMEGNNG